MFFNLKVKKKHFKHRVFFTKDAHLTISTYLESANLDSRLLCFKKSIFFFLNSTLKHSFHVKRTGFFCIFLEMLKKLFEKNMRSQALKKTLVFGEAFVKTDKEKILRFLSIFYRDEYINKFN